jgi:RimJ/RimL family protein N-acetyltransferase
MLYGLLHKIVILLDTGSSAQKEAEKACLSIAEEGLEAKTFLFSEAWEAEADSGTLCMGDSARILSALRASGRPFCAYRHANNAGEDLSLARFVVEDPAELWGRDFEKIYERETGIPWTVLTTRRLTVREFSERCSEDAAAAAALRSEPSARHFLEVPGETFPEIEDAIRAYRKNCYEFYGWGLWALVLRDTGHIVGTAGLMQTAFGTELGYLLLPSYRRRGLAAEACSGILQLAFSEFGLPEVLARAGADNTASLALLRSLGFSAAPSATCGEPSRGPGSAVLSSDPQVPRDCVLLRIRRPSSSGSAPLNPL